MGAMEESLESLRKELEGVEQEENKLRSKEVDIKHEMDKFESVLNGNKSKVKHWKKEVKISITKMLLEILISWWMLNVVKGQKQEV